MRLSQLLSGLSLETNIFEILQKKFKDDEATLRGNTKTRVWSG